MAVTSGQPGGWGWTLPLPPKLTPPPRDSQDPGRRLLCTAMAGVGAGSDHRRHVGPRRAGRGSGRWRQPSWPSGSSRALGSRGGALRKTPPTSCGPAPGRRAPGSPGPHRSPPAGATGGSSAGGGGLLREGAVRAAPECRPADAPPDPGGSPPHAPAALTDNAEPLLGPGDGHVHLVGVHDEAQEPLQPALRGPQVQVALGAGADGAHQHVAPLAPWGGGGAR